VKKAFNLILFLALAAAAHTQDSSVVKSDSVYENTEIEASYPGGPAVWQRYLYKNFSYPRLAEESKIQGTVVVQFIVDLNGKVSMVKAISGPRELHNEAVTLIKRSGVWVPAVEKGRQVKSYRRMPIVFKIEK
jgi:periplasmic protein TonB